MAYSLVDFAKSLRVDDCKITNTPRLIFLCGGKTEKAGPHLSARDFFYRYLLRQGSSIALSVKLAEDVNEWYRKDVFPDLLELESYLADFADITVLFVESPGSIAELGAFAASDVLRPTTLAVLNSFYGSKSSFISDGPVRKIENENQDLVHYYNWDPERLNEPSTVEEFETMATDLTLFMESRSSSHPKEQRLDRKKHGHVLLLIADLIGIPGVVTITEVDDCLRGLGLKLDKKQLNCYISLLESMSFIKEVRRSNQKFYVSKNPMSFVRYAYRPEASLKDRTRIKSNIRAALDERRTAVLRNFMQNPQGQGICDD